MAGAVDLPPAVFFAAVLFAGGAAFFAAVFFAGAAFFAGAFFAGVDFFDGGDAFFAAVGREEDLRAGAALRPLGVRAEVRVRRGGGEGSSSSSSSS
ncbi:hypothetical protein, partial [Streptomyces sp. NPDC056492]|uniref:hypothetical protein n=1 Tax=Streptomyces sp. NPDC056492 TaxID=3345838 RepID=UPI003690E1B9